MKTKVYIALGMTFGCLQVNALTLTDSESSIEIIEVTTNKRVANLNSISASISALTEQKIRSLGADNLQDALGAIAGVNLNQPVKNRSTINIRGINTDIGDTQLTQEPVGLYLDDMPITGTYAEILQPDISLYDINRVEVARGPQGTLYGSGNIGGAMRLITNTPELSEFGGSARLDLRKTKDTGVSKRYDGMLNLPLIKDQLALRLVASVKDEKGWINNERLNTTNNFKDTQFRASLLWSPTDELNISLKAINVDSEPEDGDSWNPNLGQFIRSTPINDGRKYDMQIYNLLVEYEMSEFATLVLSSNAKKAKANWFADLGPFGDIGDFVNQSVIESDALVHEFRLVSSLDSPLSWVAGLYFFNNEQGGLFALNVLGLQDFVNNIVPGQLENDLFIGGISDYSLDEQAIFADATYAFNNSWEASFGLRFFQVESEYSQFDQNTFDFNSFSVFPLPDYTNNIDDNGLMWRAVLAYKPRSKSHYYLNVSKGVRAGQINPNFGPSFVNPDDVFITEGYESDTLYSVELGTKLLSNDDRVQTNIALFRMHWQDIQADALRLSDNLNYIANAGDAVSQGVEVEINALVGEQTQAYFSFAWQDSRIDSLTDQQSFLSGAVKGDDLPGATNFMANIGISSSWYILDNNLLTARFDGRYVGDSVNRFSNLNGTNLPNPDFAQNDAYTYLQTSVSLDMETLTITAYIENLTDNDNIILNIGQTQTNPAISLRPRTLGLRLNYIF